MKLPYESKRIAVLVNLLEQKENDLKIANEVTLQFIKDKVDLNTLELQITKRNLLFIDISGINSQIKNLQRGKYQYGLEIQERDVKKWTD
jgi:hypothetical protein